LDIVIAPVPAATGTVLDGGATPSTVAVSGPPPVDYSV
jgi:hypothetical protein